MKIFEIKNEWDIGRARRYISEISKNIGFSSVEVGEISIVVNELCTNLIKHHSVEGKIVFKEIQDQNRVGIEIISEDMGPGISDVDQVAKDGVSTKGTMGGGIGAVRRLMDSFEIYSKTKDNEKEELKNGMMLNKYGIGTTIITKKWIKRSIGNMYQDFKISVRSRPYNGNNVNGDAYYIKESESKAILALIDGLGHGPEAHKAAATASNLLEENSYKNLKDLLCSIDKGMRNTRGAVIGICIIDKDRKSFQYGSIGNIDFRYIINNNVRKFIASSGTLGISLNYRINIQQGTYENGGIIVMNTDGISNKWEYEDYGATNLSNPAILSNMIFRDFSSDKDDATVLVAMV